MRLFRIGLPIVLFTCCLPFLYAQAPKAEPAKEDILAPTEHRAPSAAATVVATGHPVSALACVLSGKDMSVWDVEAMRSQEPPAQPAAVIESALLTGIEDKTLVRNASENMYEARAYNYFVLAARSASEEALARLSRRDLSYVHLFEDAKEYRGHLIHIEGQVKRLWRFEPPAALKREGVEALYEAWVFDKRYQSNAYCILVTSLPAGMKPGDSVNYEVACDAYLFKRYRYKGADTTRDAPLLIGKTFALLQTPPAPASAGVFQQSFLIVFIVVLIGTLALTVVMAWWYFRGDRLVQARLKQARPPDFHEREETPPPTYDPSPN